MKINNIEESVPFKKKISSEAVARRSAEACKFIKKETLVQVFSCEFGEIFHNFFYKTPPVAASEENKTLKIHAYEIIFYFIFT